MRITILTLFPEFFQSPLQASLLGKGLEQGLISVRLVQLRDYAYDKHKTVDDTPFGGGSGMVMKMEPLMAALRDLDPEHKMHRLLLSPAGQVFNQSMAAELLRHEELLLICGRYEGVDARLLSHLDGALCIGDYVLSGGEAAALVVVDALARLIPGVTGNPASIVSESFAQGLLEYPQYTRPRDFEGQCVPEELLSGNHAEIEAYREREALKVTKKNRPDLYAAWQRKKAKA